MEGKIPKIQDKVNVIGKNLVKKIKDSLIEENLNRKIEAHTSQDKKNIDEVNEKFEFLKKQIKSLRNT